LEDHPVFFGGHRRKKGRLPQKNTEKPCRERGGAAKMAGRPQLKTGYSAKNGA